VKQFEIAFGFDGAAAIPRSLVELAQTARLACLFAENLLRLN